MKKIDLNKIENLIVQRALMKRSKGFMFNYGESGDGSSASHTDWDEHGDYSERSSHTDDTAGRHTNRHTDHTESPHREHSDEDWSGFYHRDPL